MKAKCEECGELGDLQPIEADPDQGFLICKWCSHVTNIPMAQGIQLDHMAKDSKFLEDL